MLIQNEGAVDLAEVANALQSCISRPLYALAASPLRRKRDRTSGVCPKLSWSSMARASWAADSACAIRSRIIFAPASSKRYLKLTWACHDCSADGMMTSMPPWPWRCIRATTRRRSAASFKRSGKGRSDPKAPATICIQVSSLALFGMEIRPPCRTARTSWSLDATTIPVPPIRSRREWNGACSTRPQTSMPSGPPCTPRAVARVAVRSDTRDSVDTASGWLKPSEEGTVAASRCLSRRELGALPPRLGLPRSRCSQAGPIGSSRRSRHRTWLSQHVPPRRAFA